MAERNITIPQIGDTPGPYEIFEWHAKEGEDILVDQDLFTMELGKATMDVKSTYAGRLKNILKKEGEVWPGEIVAIIMLA